MNSEVFRSKSPNQRQSSGIEENRNVERNLGYNILIGLCKYYHPDFKTYIEYVMLKAILK